MFGSGFEATGLAMTVQDLNQVHRRYIRLSSAFKSAWTFHQFLQGLRKVFIDRAPHEYTVDFHGIYGQLKTASEKLNASTIGEVAQQLDRIEPQVEGLIESLRSADEQISPTVLREFFQRVKNFDDNILSQLVRFYLYSRNGQGWDEDRLDKADFVTTKLCEEQLGSGDHYGTRDRSDLREIAQGLWSTLGIPPLPDDVADGLCRELEKLRGECKAVDSIDDLSEHSLVKRYREFKHGLGDRFFEPRVLPQIVETNLALKNGIQSLYRREEQRIVAEYQQVFELEREVPVDIQLSEELQQFRGAVERFEKRLQGSDLRLDELAELRRRVRQLIPRMQPESSSNEPFVTPIEVLQEHVDPAQGDTARPLPPPATTEDAHLETQYRTIVKTLDQIVPTMDAKKASLQPELFSLGIHAREVTAYRRLFGSGTQGCNRKVEEYILRASALRLRIEQEVEQIMGILDDSSVSREGPVFDEGAVTCRLGDLFLRQFDHLIEQAILNGTLKDIRTLRFLKMRLMRSYSGLWLLLYRE